MVAVEADVGQATVDAAVMRLRAALSSARSAALSVVVDPTLADPLCELEAVQHALKAGVVARHRLPHIHNDASPKVSPYVLHFPSETRGERCVNESIAIAVSESLGLRGAEYRGRSVCAWIVGEQDPHALAVRLAGAARVVRPDGVRWPLRYWDPRVTWHLARVLPVDRQQALIAAMGDWHYLDPTNVLVPLGSNWPRGPSPSIGSMSFDMQTWAALTRIGSVNTVLSLAWDWGVFPTSANAARLDGMIQRCQALGFNTEQDALAFCACALTSADDFDAQPAVQRALRNAARQGSTVMQALQQFDDDFWLQLRAGKSEQGLTQ